MTVGASSATCIAELAATFQGTSYVVTALWAQPHIGDPGAAGTANPAAETARQNVTAAFGTAPSSPSAGVVTISNDGTFGTWSSVPATEVWTHMSFWTASSGGTFVGSATVSGGSVTSGGSWSAPAGAVVITKNCAA